MGFLIYKDWLRSLKSKTYDHNLNSQTTMNVEKQY